MRALLCLLLAFVAFAFVRRDGAYVLRVNFDVYSQKHKKAYDALLDLDYEQVAFWSSTDIRVSPHASRIVESILDIAEVPYTVVIPDVQTLVDRQREYSEQIRKREREGKGVNVNAPNPDPFFDDYRTFDEFTTWEQQQAAAYPNLVQISQAGKTYEGRAINLVTITNGTRGQKPVIFWEGGIHAREWIAHATMAYMIGKLTSGFGTDANATFLLNNFEIHIVPIVNGDGYVYTWTTDREWRKTRSPNQGSPCIGTDPNRNWDDHWCEVGASKAACSDSYCGSKAFSEIEVVSMANHVTNTQKNQKVLCFIDWHSYGQLFMGPYGWSPLAPPDATVQATVGNNAVAAIKSINGVVFQYGRIYNIIYPASGSSADWGYDEAGVVFSYGVELRDTGEYGFLLPADQIRPQGEEIWAALVDIGKFLASQ